MAEAHNRLTMLTGDIVAAHVSYNNVAVGDIGVSIRNIYDALMTLGALPEPPPPEKPKGAVSVRASLRPDHIISMIDGKPYKMLRRHIGRHGYTPETYRKAYDLPEDYPMIASDYTAVRREIAVRSGLGRKSRDNPSAKGGEPRNPKS